MTDAKIFQYCRHDGCKTVYLIDSDMAIFCAEHRGDIVPANITVEPGACTDGYVLVPLDLLAELTTGARP